jgi:RNA polymerase sigma-70 factor (ECF subfamily)
MITLLKKREQKQVGANAGLLESWARQYRLPLTSYFLKRIPRSDDVDDLVQEVFVRLSKRADLESIERVEGYVFQTAASVLADSYRKSARTPQHMASFDEAMHGQADFTPERVFLGRQELDCLIEAIYALPEKTRRIYVLYHLENIRQKEIAARLGVPVSTLEKHMARANRHLIDWFEKKR